MRLSGIEKEIAYIANPYLDYNGSVREKNLPINFIISNKLSLLLKEKGIETEVASRDMKKLGILISELCELKKDFDSCEVDFVVIKFSKLPEPHGDLDILVVSNVDNAERVLKQKGYFLEDDSEPHRKEYVKYVNGEKCLIELHLELSWRRVKYLEKEEIWRNRTERKIKDVNIPVPCPEHDILISAAHSIFQNNRIRLFDVLHIASTFYENDVDLEFAKNVARRNNWLNQFLFFIYLVNKIYKDLYGETIVRNLICDYPKWYLNRMKWHLPLHLPLHVSVLLRAEKLYLDLKNWGVRSAVNDLWAYSLDVIQISLEIAGVSSKPFFNMLRYIKKDVLRR